MTKPGHIKVKPDGVWFEYYELLKPDVKNYIKRIGSFGEIDYVNNLKKYEASKRTVEVSNIDKPFYEHHEPFVYFEYEEILYTIRDNCPCIAEITDKAEIIKIL